jgi:hypothetical protein
LFQQNYFAPTIHHAMTLKDFKSTLSSSAPPAVSESLKAMWYDGKGNWEEAHNVAQEINTREGSWIHAYLHRKEGDIGNAAYWYHRAGQQVCKTSLDEEWEAIVGALLH